MDVDASIEQVDRDPGPRRPALPGLRRRADLSAAVRLGRRLHRLRRRGRTTASSSPSTPPCCRTSTRSAGAAHALNLLNDLNRSFFFVKFTFRDGILIARYDLLGETLQAGELVNALYEIAGAADRLDDELADSLGGKPYEAKLSEYGD